MILPSSIHIAKASELDPPTTTSARAPAGGGDIAPDTAVGPRVIRKDAIVNKTDKMCASGESTSSEPGVVFVYLMYELDSVLIVKPNSSSAVHHNGEQDSIVYVASGNGVLLTTPDDEGLEPKRHELSKGDFAFIPAWTEHQALNSSEEEDLVWVVTRAGSSPVEVTLTDWNGAEVKGRNE